MLEPQYKAALDEIAQSFSNEFKSNGYDEKDPVTITSGVDKTVRFIGAPISVLKPYLHDEPIPDAGLYMIQPCVRTQNINTLFEPVDTPEYGSYFVAMGALTRGQRIAEMFRETSRYMVKRLGVDESDMFISIYSEDKDLIVAAEENGHFQLRYDVMEPDYYRHVYGMDGVWGRNTSYWLRNAESGEFEDIGNVISIERADKVIGAELALGNSTVLKQQKGLEHVLDVYDLKVAGPDVPAPVRRRLEDGTLTGMALWSEGLQPSSRNNQTRILRSYFKSISLYRRLSGLSIASLEERIKSIEEDHLPFNAKGAAEAITRWVVEYESDLQHRGPSNQEDQKVLAMLQAHGV